MLHGHGNDTINIQKQINADFSSNIWYEPLNDGLVKHLTSCLNNISNYPPVAGSNLQAKVADFYGVPANQICITSGATEAFYLIAHAFNKSSSTIVVPSFAEYNDAALMFNHSIKSIKNSELNTDTHFDTRLVWIGNPNNPDGVCIKKEALKQMLEANPEVVFVVDEAYGELCYGFESAVDLIATFNNLIIVKSVTKLCSIPGLRLGYLMASETLISKISALRMPWSVATLALEAGMYIYDNYSDFKINLPRIKEESVRFQQHISVIKDIEVFPSNTNYFLSRLKNNTAAELKQYLIEEHGFLIRDGFNFKSLDAHYFRLAVQGNKNNKDCADAIAKFMNHD